MSKISNGPKWMINSQLALDVDDGLLSCYMEQNGQWVVSTKLPSLAVEKIYELCVSGEIYKYMRKPKTKTLPIQHPIELSCCTGTVAKAYLNGDVVDGEDYGDV